MYFNKKIYDLNMTVCLMFTSPFSKHTHTSHLSLHALAASHRPWLLLATIYLIQSKVCTLLAENLLTIIVRDHRPTDYHLSESGCGAWEEVGCVVEGGREKGV